MGPSRSATRRTRVAVGRLSTAGALVLLCGCSRGVLDPQGPVGGAQKVILLDALAIMLCIIVPTILGTIAFAWWFRAGNAKARRLPQWAFSGKVELVTWSVPILTIVFLGSIAWVGSHDLDPAQPLQPPADAADKMPLQIQVVSLDWKWLFIYPDQNVASLNRLVIPVHRPVTFSLTSSSVMNTFFVPQLGSMIYVMNGMADRLNLQADHEGTYHGISGMFSGDGFPDMHFDADAVSADAFKSWVDGAKAEGSALDRAAYGQLARQSTNDPARTWGAVEPDLFLRVVQQTIPPGPGPEAKIIPKAGG